MDSPVDQTVPPWVDATMPPHGPCAFCGGPDARHRVLDAIASRIAAGESARSVADDYGYPIRFVGRVARELTSEAHIA
jgi:hypothetical protein